MGIAKSSEVKTILLVEDGICLATFLKKLLIYEGYNVLLASDGKEAVDMYKASAELIDIVLMDICMPVMDGIEAHRVLNCYDPTVSILLMSGSDNESLGELNNPHFIRKPMAPEELFKTISNIIETSQTNLDSRHRYYQERLG